MNELVPPAPVAHCCATLQAAGYPAYPVGGCVRDLLLGRVPDDWDVATAARPESVTALFPHTIPTGIVHGTVTVLLDGATIEVTTFRREGGYTDARHPDRVTFDADLTADLSRRDFTINAMALQSSGAVTDPFGGQSDLAARLIRCVGDPNLRFREDALRMLRCLRFSAQLGFAVEPATMDALRKNAPLAARLSAERVTAEVEKTLRSPRPEVAGTLAQCGLLAPYLPPDSTYDLEPLQTSPPTAEARWRAFCAATGLEIEALPVTRSVRRAVRYRPENDPTTLAITGGELHGLGLVGEEISVAQRALLAHVALHPAENTKERLLAHLRGD